MEEFVEMKSSIVLPYLEMVITTKCNMKCVNCSNNIPTIRHKASHVSANVFSLQLTALFKVVSEINKFQIHGGEPFLNPDLPEIAKTAINEHSLKQIRIATNGTVPMSPALIEALAGNRAVIAISSYWFNRESRNAIVDQCKKAAVPFILYDEQPWYGFTEKNNGTRMKYEDCPINGYLCYYDWRLYLCSRICHSSNNPTYSIDVRKTLNLSKELCDQRLKGWCRFCNISQNLVESGVQITNA